MSVVTIFDGAEPPPVADKVPSAVIDKLSPTLMPPNVSADAVGIAVRPVDVNLPSTTERPSPRLSSK